MASVQRTRILDAQGRVYIPVEYRAALGWQQGDALIIELVDGELRVRGLHEAVRRAQEVVRRHTPKGRSHADEPSAERRGEAERE